MQEALCFLSCGYGLETTHVTNKNLFRAAKRQSTSAVGGARSVVMKTVGLPLCAQKVSAWL